jgi:hypothetical protein
VSDVVPTFRRREERERRGDKRRDVIEAARAGGTEEGFQFRERVFDRIEVRTVGRQKSDLRAGGFDDRAHFWLFVDGEIVQHNDIASPERRDEHLLHVGAKAGLVDRSIKHRRRRDPVGPQGGDDRVRLPMAAGCVIAQPHAAETAPVSAQQIGRHATLIDKDVLPRVVQWQPVAPVAPLSGDVGAPLFGGVDRFF